MTRTLLLTGLRDLLRRPLHTGLMVLGVALGVAVSFAAIATLTSCPNTARTACSNASSAPGKRSPGRGCASLPKVCVTSNGSHAKSNSCATRARH